MREDQLASDNISFTHSALNQEKCHLTHNLAQVQLYASSQYTLYKQESWNNGRVEGIRYRLCEAASLRQAFSLFLNPDTRVLRPDEACLTTLFALVQGGCLAAAHDEVR
jgi:hypothetical protein